MDILDFARQGTAAARDTVHRSGAPDWLMLVLGLVMFGGWSLTYLFTILKARRDKSYGIPMLNTCLNFSWEFMFSFNIMGGLPKFIFPLQIGHLLWLLPNFVNVYQTVTYGPALQKWNVVAKYFKTVFAITLVISFFMLLTFQWYARDVYGVASSWIINVLMSGMFIKMFIDRRNDIAPDGVTVRGMSLKAATFKLIGNAGGAIFCFFWWEAQFAAAPDRIIRHAGLVVTEPPSYAFLNLVYAVNIALDVALIVLLYVRERELRRGARMGSEVPSGLTERASIAV